MPTKLLLRSTFLLLISLFLFLSLTSCGGDDTISMDDEAYQTAVSNFYISLAASQTEEARFAFNKMNEVATSFPEEPAAWANLGVMAMRQGNFNLAEERFDQARELIPENSTILFLSGIFESRRGNVDAVVDYLKSALESDPDNYRIQFMLIDELERQDNVTNADEIVSRIENLYSALPQNQAVLFETARIAAKEQEEDLLRNALQSMAEFSQRWPQEAVELFDVVQNAAEEEEFGDLNFELAFLRNAVEPTPAFQADLREIQMELNQVGFLIDHFIALPKPEFRAASPDLGITFSDFAESTLPIESVFVKQATLLEDRPPFSLYSDGGDIVLDEEVRLPMPVGSDDEFVSPNMMAEIDYNYNFRNDIVLAGSRGFRLYRQEDYQNFTDVTSSLGLSNAVIDDSYRGVWPADVDLDGDLDLVLTPTGDRPFALRNNSDGTFTHLDLFDGMEVANDFIWADLDNDGANDALFLTDSGRPVIYRNLRSKRVYCLQ